jgi:myosin heavy subunit
MRLPSCWRLSLADACSARHAVNPYERLHDLYTQEVMARFNGAGTFDDNPPHLYAVAEAAFAHM